MAHLLVTAMPFAGHARPMTAVAAALLERGHRVTAYTGAAYADAFDELGCEVVQWRDAQDFDELHVAATFPRVDRPGLLGSFGTLRDLLLGTAAGQLEDIAAAHARDPFDALVGDVMAVGTALAAERLGLPWATISLVPLSLPSQDLPPAGLALRPGQGVMGRVRDRVLRALVPTASRSLDRAWQAVRAQAGLPRGKPFGEALYSPRLVIATGSPLLEWPRGDLPASVEFVGLLAPREAHLDERPLWTETLAGEPRAVVLVTQGTFETDPRELLVPALEGLAHDPVRVVGTTAGVAFPVEVPANARLVDFVPFAAVAPHASVGVTNGGWVGVLEMLSVGVPLVVAGGSLDKPEIAARVAWSGAGIDLRTRQPRPIRVRNAVREVLREPSFRERARAISDEFATLGGATRTATLVEGLLPVQPPERRRTECRSHGDAACDGVSAAP
ncbi:glycosyltransferase [Agrococcus carbonis]|nr:glycosyltransferase [Agrococcus carbonis]